MRRCLSVRSEWLVAAAVALPSCSLEEHYLGYDGVETLVPKPEPGDAGDTPSVGPSEDDDGPSSQGGNGGRAEPRPGAGGRNTGGSGGDDPSPPVGGAKPDAGGASGAPAPPPEDAGPSDEGDGGTDAGGPPNYLVDLLGQPIAAVDRRIEERFQQLFHGDPATESIYVEVEDGGAYIRDIFHQDTRADALGHGMLIAVWLDKRTEFDAIWTFTKTFVQYAEGPRAGLLHGTCPDPAQPCSDDVGMFGGFNAVTALLLAEARWGNGEGILDYGTEARSVLETLRTLESRNTDETVDVTDVFGSEQLPARFPSSEFADQTLPETLMPAYFDYWAERTGDDYWAGAAIRSRDLLRAIVNPENGLSPSAAYFDGTLVVGEEDFYEGSYYVGLNLAIDTAWYAKDPEQVVLANRLVSFFAAFGGSYVSYFRRDGAPLTLNTSGALVALNGCAAGIATVPEREDFIRTVWEAKLQTGQLRYFDGINQLLSMMYLGGYVRPF